MDIVFIRDLEIECIIGIWGWERKMPQTVNIDIDIGTDVANAAETEDIEHCVDYKSVSQTVTSLVKEGRFKLVETLADRVQRSVGSCSCEQARCCQAFARSGCDG
jgi:dihydroneopterin aldolase